jgi:cyclophilin family peptidyl-prolyl cis-trans isomerase
MRYAIALPVAVMAIACARGAAATDVVVCTDQGQFVMELAEEKSPQHVANFLRYVDMQYYSGTVFHRVMPGFVVQGGGVDRHLRGRPTLPPVENESRNGLSNLRGSVAAARTQEPNSATSQFFVNLEDNTPLDASKDLGYTVFARVKEGIQVVDAISRLPTGASGPFKADVPMPLVAIKSIARLDEAALAALPADDREAAIKQRVTEAAAAQNYPDTLQWVGHYRAICGAADPAISVLEARAALGVADQRRAVFVLEEYFATTNRDDPTYEDAVALYREAVPENQQSAAQLVNDCTAPVAPDIPDGAAASMEQMVAGQSRMKEFVAASETYIACLTKIIDDQARGAEERNTAIGAHNRMVSAMEQAAATFNTELREFKARP